MKNRIQQFGSLFLILFISVQAHAQRGHICNHRPSYERSAIGDTLDAIHYHIHLDTLDFTAKTFRARTTVELKSKVDNLDQVTLELLDLTVDSTKIDGQPASFSHEGHSLRIPLTDPLNTGDNVTAEIFYHGAPFHEDWGGFHWSGQYAFNLGVGFVSIPHNLGKAWFPCIDDFMDRAYYDVYTTTPEEMEAVCGGSLVDMIDNGDGTVTWHWSISNTIPTYLASVAVGDYEKYSDVFNGAEGDIPIEIYVRPQDTAKVPGSFLNLKEILDIFEEKYGPYPFERIGYVGTAIGAMEHATNIAYPNFCIDNSTTYESLYAHEISHMWFGDNATCSSAQEMWLNEGWAVFSEALYREFLYGKEEYKDFMREMHADVLQVCHTSSGDGSYFPLNQIPEEVTYGMTAYDRGATVAHSLRGYLGDEIFFDAMRAYNEHFAFDYVSSYDMRDFLTAHTGIDMSGFFESWVFTEGTPHFSIDSFAIVPVKEGAEVTVYMKQKRKGSDYIGHSNIVELTFMDQFWKTHTDTIHFSGETGHSTFQIPFIPNMVMCDPDEKLCDATTDYAMTIREPDEYDLPETYFDLEVAAIPDSAFIRAVHNWAPPDSLKTPVQGLRISDYRYWKINGIFPTGMEATGVFWYNKSGNLDNTLLTNPGDSVVILYRPNAGFDWQFVDFEQIGLWSIGNLYVDNIQPGEYVLAVCDSSFVGINTSYAPKKEMVSIHPNPSGGVFYFSSDAHEPLYIRLYDVSGREIGEITLPANKQNQAWKPTGSLTGTLFARVMDDRRQTLMVKKLILEK